MFYSSLNKINKKKSRIFILIVKLFSKISILYVFLEILYVLFLKNIFNILFLNFFFDFLWKSFTIFQIFLTFSPFTKKNNFYTDGQNQFFCLKSTILQISKISLHFFLFFVTFDINIMPFFHSPYNQFPFFQIPSYHTIPFSFFSITESSISAFSNQGKLI